MYHSKNEKYIIQKYLEILINASCKIIKTDCMSNFTIRGL